MFNHKFDKDLTKYVVSTSINDDTFKQFIIQPNHYSCIHPILYT